jgi:hypothetical protein
VRATEAGVLMSCGSGGDALERNKVDW